MDKTELFRQTLRESGGDTATTVLVEKPANLERMIKASQKRKDQTTTVPIEATIDLDEDEYDAFVNHMQRPQTLPDGIASARGAVRVCSPNGFSLVVDTKGTGTARFVGFDFDELAEFAGAF